MCHKDEVTLLLDSEGDRGAGTCLSPGELAFCCKTETFSNLINSCSLSGCGKDCGSGFQRVAEKYDPRKQYRLVYTFFIGELLIELI